MASFLVCTLLSCQLDNGMEKWQDSRNIIEEAVIVSMDDSLPPLHAFTKIRILGDTMIFHDIESTDRQFLGYDLENNKCLGWFGIFGNGPGEIANFGARFFDYDRRILYGMNGNQWSIMGFELDKALSDSMYKAFEKVSLAKLDLRVPINQIFYVNDSTVICHMYQMNENWTRSTSRIGRLNLENGSTEVIDNYVPEESTLFDLALSIKDSLICATYSTNDQINLYNLDGTLKKIIFGPDYHNPRIRKVYYFNNPVICGDKICVVYQGKSDRTFSSGRNIMIFDLEGNYLKTLHCGMHIICMDYHKKTNRLYISTKGDPQFGYIQL